MDTQEVIVNSDIKEEVISITGLLSDEEINEIGITKDDIENPTEEILKKIQEYFQEKAKEISE